MSKAIDELVELVSEMPGIGPRQARRVVQFLLQKDTSYKNKLTKGIQDIEKHVTACKNCFKYDEVNPKGLCSLCANHGRSTTLLMIVEKDVDIESVENAGIYRGHYFVLASLMPLARQRKSTVAPRTTALFQRIKNEKDMQEVVLAFATTPEGDFTAKELAKLLKDEFPKIKISMLGRGLSLGAEIEYADQETLRNAFDGRH